MSKRQPSIIPADYSNSLNPFVYNEIEKNKKVLDVGCWNGNLGKLLVKEKKCSVDGLDIDKKILKEAKRNGYKNVFDINLNSDPDKLLRITQKYDVIVCADILEHIIDPGRVLQLLEKLLSPSGIIIISMPNVAFGLNRLNLLLGKWDYTEFGTLDKTHLRFFTSRTLKELIKTSGLTIIKFRPYNQFGLLKKLYPLDQILPNFLCYQLLAIAKKK